MLTQSPKFIKLPLYNKFENLTYIYVNINNISYVKEKIVKYQSEYSCYLDTTVIGLSSESLHIHLSIKELMVLLNGERDEPN